MPRRYSTEDSRIYHLQATNPNWPDEDREYRARRSVEVHPDSSYQKVITMRFNKHLLERVDRLIPIFQETQEGMHNSNSGRSAVIRTLIELGLQHYEGDEILEDDD